MRSARLRPRPAGCCLTHAGRARGCQPVARSSLARPRGHGPPLVTARGSLRAWALQARRHEATRPAGGLTATYGGEAEARSGSVKGPAAPSCGPHPVRGCGQRPDLRPRSGPRGQLEPAHTARWSHPDGHTRTGAADGSPCTRVLECSRTCRAFPSWPSPPLASPPGALCPRQDGSPLPGLRGPQWGREKRAYAPRPLRPCRPPPLGLRGRHPGRRAAARGPGAGLSSQGRPPPRPSAHRAERLRGPALSLAA